MAIFKKNNNKNSPIENKPNTINNSNSLWDVDSSIVETAEEGENINENNRGFVIKPEYFGELKKYVLDNDITDIDFNGTDLWLTDINNRHWKDTTLNISPAFIRKLAQNIANSESKEFNQKKPVMEAETEDLRISIVHNSIAQTGTTMCIRKTPKKERITERKAIESGYCTLSTLSLLVNCIKAHLNFVICGEPRAGKTECAKFFSGFIPEGERVITIEDVMEWHYKALHPQADVIEMKINSDFTYSDGIVASLKQNPKWIMIAETRGKEVKHLIQSFTTGVNGITTLHTDDVRKIPSRIVNMADDSLTAERMENSVYEFVDVGLFISMSPDGNGGQRRMIDQVAFFSNDNDINKAYVIIESGEVFKLHVPDKILKKFKIAGIDDIFYNEDVIKNLTAQGYKIPKEEIDARPRINSNGDTSQIKNDNLNAYKQPFEYKNENTNSTQNILHNLMH